MSHSISAADNPPRPLRVALIAFVLVLIADQTTKTIAVNGGGRSPDWPGPFWFHLIANRGGLLGLPVPVWVMIGATLAVIAAGISAVRRNAPTSSAIGWAMVIGGAMGNLIDRFRHRPRFPDHAVVDWIASASLPTFNLADVAIVAGVVLLARSGRRVTEDMSRTPHAPALRVQKK